MALCEPLCRSCHMRKDGRLAALRKNAPYQRGRSYTPKQPCKVCKRLFKPLRNSMCYSCSERHREGGRSFAHCYHNGCCHEGDSR